MSNNRNNCVYCAFEDGIRCTLYNKQITMNDYFVTLAPDPGFKERIYGNQEECEGFELEPCMASRWKEQFE